MKLNKTAWETEEKKKKNRELLICCWMWIICRLYWGFWNWNFDYDCNDPLNARSDDNEISNNTDIKLECFSGTMNTRRMKYNKIVIYKFVFFFSSFKSRPDQYNKYTRQQQQQQLRRWATNGSKHQLEREPLSQ